MPELVYCGNTYNPRDRHADMYILRSFHETPEEASRHHFEWLKGKLIGSPMSTPTYTTEQLTEMGMVSVWAMPTGYKRHITPRGKL